MAKSRTFHGENLYSSEIETALHAAAEASRTVGKVLKRNLDSPKKIDSAIQHDIKLALDVQSQASIEKRLKKALPQAGFVGEEGEGKPSAGPLRWVVDPIDGTVNFAYGIPHACISIALQVEASAFPAVAAAQGEDYITLMGLIHDPFCDETWTATWDGPSRLNGRTFQVSPRKRMDEAIIAMGFSKSPARMRQMLPIFQALIPRVRKMRMMGAAALDLAYVACGRMDAYLEGGVRLWDIAAGGLILERAGGTFWRERMPGDEVYRVLATNGKLHAPLAKICKFGDL